MGARLTERSIIGEFYNQLEIGQIAWVNRVGMLFNSDQESETYKWLGSAPAMREWIGGRNAKGFTTNGITITNKIFEATLEVLKREIDLDKTGQVMTRVRELAQRANAHWATLTTTLIQNGASTTCYDGEYFFDTDHSEGSSSTQSNDLTCDISALGVANHGTATAPTAEEMQYAILAAVQAILGFKDDQGEPMNETASEFLVMVPTPFMQATAAALTLPTFGGGATNLIPNLNNFRIDFQVNPRLTWTDTFAVFRTDGQTKPFILQEEQPITMSAVASGSELEFNERKHRYGIEAIRNVGYGYWQHACLQQLV